MFNSIITDQNRRKLVKKFEIAKLQDKVVQQAIAHHHNAIDFSHRVPQSALKIERLLTPNEEATNVARKQLRSLDASRYASNASVRLPSYGVTSVVASQSKSTKTLVDQETALSLPHRRCSKTLRSNTKDNNQNNHRKSYSEKLMSSLWQTKLKRAKYLFDFSVEKKLNLNSNTRGKSSLSRGLFENFTQSSGNRFTNVTLREVEDLVRYRDTKLILETNSITGNGSKTRIKNRCIETGRAHSVLRFCKLSRICLRDKASQAIISGVSKASW